MASSLALLKYQDPVAWGALAGAAESRMSKFSPRAVSGLLWAFAVAKVGPVGDACAVVAHT